MKVHVHLAFTVLNVIISAIAKTIHLVIHQPVNVSANVGGLEELAIRNVHQGITGRIVRNSVLEICQRRQHAITLLAISNADLVTSVLPATIHAKKELTAKTASINVIVRTAANVHISMVFVIAFQAGRVTIVVHHVPTPLGATTAKRVANALTMRSVVDQMDCVFVSQASWDRSVRKFVPRDFMVRIVSRLAAAIETQTLSAILLMVVSANLDSKEAIAISRCSVN